MTTEIHDTEHLLARIAPLVAAHGYRLCPSTRMGIPVLYVNKKGGRRSLGACAILAACSDAELARHVEIKCGPALARIAALARLAKARASVQYDKDTPYVLVQRGSIRRSVGPYDALIALTDDEVCARIVRCLEEDQREDVRLWVSGELGGRSRTSYGVNGHPLQAGMAAMICHGTECISGRIAYGAVIMTMRGHQPANGHYFISADGEIVGLCLGMRLRLLVSVKREDV